MSGVEPLKPGADADPAATRPLQIGEWQADSVLDELRRGEQVVKLEPRKMRLLMALARRPQELVTLDQLLDEVWGDLVVTPSSVYQSISQLRSVLGDEASQPRYIVTVPRKGYRLMVPVSAVEATPAALPGGCATQADVVLAVLPFQNLSGRPEEEHVADGLTELLIAQLACTPTLRVISRTSSMHYKSRAVRLPRIAAELGASLIVEGSLLRSERHLQVVVQLIDTATDLHLFSRSWTRALAELLPLQNEIASAIAEAVAAHAGPTVASTVPPQGQPRRAAVSHEGLQAYLLARHFWAQRTAAGFEKASAAYEQCIASDPGFAPAHAGLADTLLIMALYGVANPGLLADRAQALAERALALDPTSAEALTAQGGVALFLGWDLENAAGWFRRALAANPSHDVARLGLADALMFGRDFDAGLRHLKTAMSLNPFDLGLAMNEGDFLVWCRRFDEAIAALERTLDIGGHFWPARMRLAQVHALCGDASAAEGQLAQARAQAPAGRGWAAQGYVAAALGDTAGALTAIAQLEHARAQGYVPPGDIARIWALLGDVDRALTWVDMGIAERSPPTLMLGIDAAFDRIRRDERFVQRLQRCGVR